MPTTSHGVPGATRLRGAALRMLRLAGGPDTTLVLGLGVLALGFAQLLIPRDALPVSHGLRAAEAMVLHASGLGELTRSGWVHGLVLLLLLQLLLRLWLRALEGAVERSGFGVDHRFGHPTATDMNPRRLETAKESRKAGGAFLRSCFLQRSSGYDGPNDGRCPGFTLRGQALPLLGLLGLASSLGIWLWDESRAVSGELELGVGEARETCDTRVSGRPVQRFLGMWVGLSRWDPLRAAGEIELRSSGSEPVLLPVAPGHAALREGWRFVPVAQRRDPRPLELSLRWRARSPAAEEAVPAAGALEAPRTQQAALRLGEPIHVVPHGDLVWEQFREDFAGLGPAALVLHVDEQGSEDRRWVLIEGEPGYEAEHRTGPLVLEPAGLRWGQRVLLKVEHRLASPFLHLGLILLVVAGLLDLWFGSARSRAFPGARA